MTIIENEALETAKKNAEKALAEYKETNDKNALYRYLEAVKAYRTLVTVRYNL